MFPYTNQCSVARPPAEATPPLAYLVRSAVALSALDIERTSNTAHEEETTGVFGLLEFPRQVPALQESSVDGRLAHPDQLALEAYFASSSHRQRL